MKKIKFELKVEMDGVLMDSDMADITDGVRWALASMIREGNWRDRFEVGEGKTEAHGVIDRYKLRARANRMADILHLLFEEAHNYMGTAPTSCIYDFQFDGIVDKIDKIYHPTVVLDNESVGLKTVEP